MFIQKLELDPNQSYCTNASTEHITECLHLSYKHIIILTPFSSGSDSIETIKTNLSLDTSVSTVTPKVLLDTAELFECTHVILEDRSLFEKFELDLSNIAKPIIEIGNIERFPLLNLCKMYIQNREEDSFVVLFILSKLFTGKVVSTRPRKLEIFFKVFNIEWEIVNNVNESDSCECIVFMDKYTESKAERIFCLGDTPKKFNKIKIDLALAGKYKSRIGEVYRAITPAVAKGHKEFDYTKFLSVSK